MKRENNACLRLQPTPSSGAVEIIASRQRALNRYCELFARGFFPIMAEQADGMFHVSLSTDEPR